MFAVRRGLIDESLLRVLLQRLAEQGEVDPSLATATDLMQSLALKGAAATFSEAAYRFAAFEPGMDAVLSGTSSAAHLRENLQAVGNGQLPDETLVHLKQVFGKIDSISGQVR
jgi:aryl-alcohol dehydrogenase-like predicted oxidoreductase